MGPGDVAGLLASPHARVLLAGSGTQAAGSGLPPVPAVETTLADLGRCLVDRAGLDPDYLTTLLDPAGPQELSEALWDSARGAREVFLFYYVGHGLISPQNELHLATRATVDLSSGVPRYQALPYSVVDEVLAQCPARLIVIVLDCCFAARAHGMTGGAERDAFDSAQRRGVYLLAAAGRDEAAWAPPGDRHTAFTGELIRLLTEGDPGGPPRLTLDSIYRCLVGELTRRNLPRPRRQAADDSDVRPLAANPAYRRPEPPGLPYPPGTSGPGDAFSPYRGLAAFGTDDAPFYFGRDELAESLAERVADGPGPLVVTGPSGSGKSSLLRAGLIPRLRSTDPLLACLIFTPGADPLNALDRRVAALTGTPARELAKPDQLVAALRAIRPVIVVDQFEELFTACRDESLRRRFVAALCAISRQDAARVVLGVRADFYGHCAIFPELVAALERPVIVGPMGTAQLRDAIEKPAAQAGLALQDGLAELLIQELGATGGTASDGRGGGTLPLLSHALLATWQRMEDRTLTLAGYHATGGIAQALTKTADTIMDGFDPEGRRVTRRLFLRLIRFGEGTEDTRRRVPLTDLLPIAGTPEDEATRHVLNRFVEARLITTDEDTAEITHEALIRNWTQLGSWIDADRAGLLIHQQLAEDTASWSRHGRDPAYLYTATRLVAARITPTDELTDAERAFLAASAHRDRRRTRITRQVIAVLTILLITAAGAGVYAFREGRIALQQRDTQISRQLASTTATLGDGSLAAQLSLAAYQIAPTPEARGALLSRLSATVDTRIFGDHGSAFMTAFSHDGRLLAASFKDGAVRLWDVSDRGHPKALSAFRSGTEPVSGLAFSPAGQVLAVGSNDHTAHLWDLSDPGRPKTLATLTGHSAEIYQVAYSPDGRLLATASGDETVRLWEVSTPTRPTALAVLKGHTASVDALAFSSDGHTLATGSNDFTARLWDLSDPARPQALSVLKDHVNGVSSVAFSPDGRILTTASYDNTDTVWDVSDRAHPMVLSRLRNHSSQVFGVAHSSTEHVVADASRDGTIDIWDITDPKNPQLSVSLTSHANSVISVGYSPDGGTLVSSSGDGTIRLWPMFDPLDPSFRPALVGHTNSVLDLAYSPDGKRMITGSADQTARLWDISDLRRPRALQSFPGYINDIQSVAFSPDGHTVALGCFCGDTDLWDITDSLHARRLATIKGSYVTSVVFSPDHRTLATASTDNHGYLWDISDLAHPKALATLAGHTDSVASVTFSPDGRILASASADHTVRLWNVTDPSHPRTAAILTGHTGSVPSAVFRPDGRALATVSEDQTVRLWDITQISRPITVAVLRGHAARVNGAAFSPDGKTLVTGSVDKTAQVWDVSQSDRPQEMAVLQGPTGSISAVAYSPDGKSVATTSGNSGQLWSLDVGLAMQRICATTGAAITPEEWNHYVPDLPYNPPCRDR